MLPEDYLRGCGRQRANVRYVALFAVVIAAVICAEVASEQKVSQALAHQARVNAAYADAGSLLARMRELESRKAEMLRKADLTASLIDRVPSSTLLGVVTNALTREVVVTSLDLRTHTLLVRSVTPRPKKQTGNTFTTSSRQKTPVQSRTLLSMQVTGLAADDAEVAKFIANLSRNALISKVDLVCSVEKKVEGLTVREFQIKISVKPGIDAIDVLQASGTQPSRRRPAGAEQGEGS